MTFTDTQLELLFTAWALHARNASTVIAEDAECEADQLVDAGWLERRTLANGDAVYGSTRQAEIALDVGALIASVGGREN